MIYCLLKAQGRNDRSGVGEGDEKGLILNQAKRFSSSSNLFLPTCVELGRHICRPGDERSGGTRSNQYLP